MSFPLASIIIPVFNSEKYLAATIKCALDQSWPNKEIIIIDDGSADNSLEIARQFESSKLIIETQANRGASAARNRGLALAKGDYIQFLDADDLISSAKIEEQIKLLENKDGFIATCPTVFFKEDEDPSGYKPYSNWFDQNSEDPIDFLKNLYGGPKMDGHYAGMVAVHAWLTPRYIIDQAGRWNEQLSVDDDGEFFFRVCLCAKGIIDCPTVLNYYRKHRQIRSLSAQLTKKAFKSMLLSNYLKHKYLYRRGEQPLANQIFAKYFWFAGVAAFPKYSRLSSYAIKKAKRLGYVGKKYDGGSIASSFTIVLGWKLIRYLSYLKHGF